jgi:hypothetical protein
MRRKDHSCICGAELFKASSIRYEDSRNADSPKLGHVTRSFARELFVVDEDAPKNSKPNSPAAQRKYPMTMDERDISYSLSYGCVACGADVSGMFMDLEDSMEPAKKKRHWKSHGKKPATS